ncbi:Golgi SNAP receptor complex member 1-1 [Zostera marina]|uniref:Golgi SNAP receptor complex member 1 n=1 Tax=Zostera marina TaxID=29655 RepID=A0A0K9PYB9_ZOSMR|nr:Golgi SNAP receptor complex member 1-1 [Zostera marina]
MQGMNLQSMSWDALRKQARTLQDHLDEQMNSFRRLVLAKTDSSWNDLESEIEASLKQLQQVNAQMKSLISSGGSEFFSHTLTRHQEILQDFTQEFFRIRSSYRAKREHASLLQDFKEFDRTRFDVEENGSSAEHALLNEHASLNRSTTQTDTVISQAQATLSALSIQRSMFGGINSKIGNVGSRLPTVNNVLTAIKRRKSLDTIIISAVASTCTFLIFIYWLSK